MDHENIRQLVLEAGADNAVGLVAQDIVFNSAFREICENNGYGNYGMCWMCPPDVGGIDDLMGKAQVFTHAVMYQAVYPVEDSLTSKVCRQRAMPSTFLPGSSKNERMVCSNKTGCTWPRVDAIHALPVQSARGSFAGILMRLWHLWKLMASMFTARCNMPVCGILTAKTRSPTSVWCSF